MEDSVGALYCSYEWLRDRYNSLKAEHKALALSKTCCHCKGSLERKAVADRNLHLDINSVPKTCETPVNAQNGLNCTSPETAELIREVTVIREKLARALSSPNDESDFSCLTNAFASLCELQKQISPEHNSADSHRLSYEACGTPLSCGDNQSKRFRDPDVCNTKSIQTSGSFNDDDDHLWMETANELAASQHRKLELMHKKLSQQSERLQNLMASWKELLSTAQHVPPIHGENYELNTDEWSLLPS